MLPPPANVRRHFLPWDRPLLPQAAAFLARGWAGEGPLDLSNTLVLVPTRQSGRRLREALAAHAATKGAAVFPPRVVLPEALVTAAGNPEVATPLTALLAWCDVLRGIELDEFRAVFPVDPPERNFAWAWRLARDFTRLQHALVEVGLRLAEVTGRVGEAFPELERWQQIGQLEAQQAERLAERGLQDPHAARLDTAARGTALAELLGRAEAEGDSSSGAQLERIVILATPDPMTLALSVLAQETHLPIEVVVFADETEGAAFDAWGRPVAEAWGARTFALDEFERHVHLCAGPEAQAQRIGELARVYEKPDGLLGVGVADVDVTPWLEQTFAAANIKTFNPEGRRRRQDGLHALLAALAALARDGSFATTATLVRCPDFLAFLAARNEDFAADRFLRELDKLHTRFLPPTLAEAQRHKPDNSSLAAVADVRTRLRSGEFPENAMQTLATIFAARRFDLGVEADRLTVDSAEAWAQALREITGAQGHFPGLAPEDGWDLALALFGESVRHESKADGAVALQGWLELLWEDAPHVVVAGLNDGRVPDAVVGDPFLPESLRVRLGLKTNATRFARDAYLLQALVASRGAASGGRIDLLVGKTSSSGDPLRPSRLLFRCADTELPQRVRFLFRGVSEERANPAWRRAWRLQPRRVAAPEKMAVTSLRAWLQCPFRFYLSKVLRMEAIEPGKTELDVFDFGTLSHAALEAMGREPALRDCKDPAVLREFLLAQLDLEATRRFSREVTLPLVVQLESARQRLSRVAEIQAQTRAEGWVTVLVEQEFQLPVAGLTIVGKIDRIDKHETTGALRVLDYKTSDRAVEPRDAHLRGLRRDETPPGFALWLGGDRELVWSDLQLPLYLRFLTQGGLDLGGSRENVTAAYFNLPKAAGDTKISPWEDYSLELEESAWRCAEGVATAIKAGEFWPPNEGIRPESDDFAALFHHGVADSVTWEAQKS